MSTENVNLTNCDREPIHVPGSIQPHGALIACDLNLERVLRHSRNAVEFLALPQASLIGESVERVFGERATHDLRNAFSKTLDPSRPSQLIGFRRDGGEQAFDVSVHRHKGVAIIEIEPHSSNSDQSLEICRTLIARIRDLADVRTLVTQTTRLLRGLLEYDRVMIYQFASDGSGQVVAESKRADLESFSGQHFPASDIPQQARQLYLRNTIRVIGDSAGNRIAIDPVVDASGEPLDLSYAHLRSVSPVHCEYLRNMGVSASMSISIIIGGELWGLVACHHYKPRSLTMGQRIAAELFGEFLSLQLDTLRQRERIARAGAARGLLDKFLRDFSSHDDFRDFLRESLPDLSRLIQSDGVGLWIEGAWTPFGKTPPAKAVPALARFLNDVSEGRVWATHELGAHLPGAGDYQAEVCGVLVIPLTQAPRDYLLFFRREVIQTVEWGGDPNKSYESGPLGDRLTPRKSFAIWKESVERQSLPWSEPEREIAEATRIALLEVILRHSETLTEERRKAEVRQKILNEELNHRVKNILALIKSLVSQPTKAGVALSDYVAALKKRIMALSFAHDQIVRNDGGGSPQTLLDAELSPYRENAGRVVLDGPNLALDGRAFSVLTLVIHEMATNAAKYGALSVAGGTLAVTWRQREDGSFLMRWKESGGPPVSPPSRGGFGTVLIDRSIPYDLGGTSEVDYALDGVEAVFTIPARFVSARPVSEELPSPEMTQTSAPESLSGLRIMLVEDQLVIAMDVENMLAGHGAGEVVTFATSSEALRGLAQMRPDVGVLDVNLGSGTSIPIAEELARLQVPFVFATGYGDSTMIPKALSAVPILRKPYDADTLLAALGVALEARN